MNSFTQSDIAKFVIKFLADNGSVELVKKWNSQENIEAFKVVSKPVPKKQAKKKSVEYPKKMTGCNYFYSANRERVKVDNLEMNARDVTRELSRLWKELPKEEQKQWSASSAELYTYWKNKIM
jgi:hypothetical protein